MGTNVREVAADAINLFLEYRDSHGYDEGQAEAMAVQEIVEAEQARIELEDVRPKCVEPPIIWGTPMVGRLLRATDGVWEHVTKITGYQWFRDNVPIAHCNTHAYVPVAADVGFPLSVKVYAFPSWAMSAQTAPVMPASVQVPAEEVER